MPTICFNIPGITPQDIAQDLGEVAIGVRDGHMFAPRLMNRLNLSMETGALRISMVHYNTLDEVTRFDAALGAIVARRG